MAPIIYWGCIIKKFILIILLPLVFLSAADKGVKTTEPVYQTEVDFRGFAWGTSMADVVKKMGQPISREKVNGMESLLWENVVVQGYATYMVAYFSPTDGLQGGIYYFLTYNMDELILCYKELQTDLEERFGPTKFHDEITKELRHYKSEWDLPGGSYAYLRVNTREGEPVTLWYSSPELTKRMFGIPEDSVTAKK